ncbi:anti-sigma factor [Vulcanimicrobium alpinum]|nr:anti-sigma factor [Vulcanimicrobium alpinum]
MSVPMPRDEMMEVVALYALGVLPREESALVAAFVAGDDDARREYHDLRAAADTIAFAAEEPVDSAASARMKERLVAKVRADAAGGNPVARRRIGPNPGWLWGTGLAAAAALVFSFVTVAQDVALRGDLAQTKRRAETLANQLAQTERVSRNDRQTLTDLVSSDARRYEVAQGAVVVRGDHVYFALSKLPALPKGRVYQAWTVLKGAKAVQPSVTFTPNADGVAVVQLPVDALKIGAVAVTVEPDGGSKAPTTSPTFVRPLS